MDHTQDYARLDPKTKVILTKTWHKVLRELQLMALALPGARGLFSLLKEAFRHEELARPRLRLTKAVHASLADFRTLAADVTSRPTRIAEIVPTSPTVVGACDAARSGMGRVFFVNGEAYPWRRRFDHAVRQALVTFDNPSGTINNSDLELAGNVGHHAVIASVCNVHEHTIWTGSDNTANVHWNRILRDQALHQRQHRYVPTHDYVPGTANAMADDCSRLWHLNNSQLLHYFNHRYPQIRSCQQC